jgi:hypothetical protein
MKRVLKYMKLRPCKQCGKDFYNSHKSANYCSIKCGAAKRVRGINKNCLKCGKEFWAFRCKLNKGKSFYCSRNCANQSNPNKGEQHWHWKTEGLGYIGVHLWVHKYFGNPQSCEICGLKRCHQSNGRWNIDWAKLKDKKYERKRENFWGLCKKCHSKYDLTEEKVRRLRNMNNKINN